MTFAHFNPAKFQIWNISGVEGERHLKKVSSLKESGFNLRGFTEGKAEQVLQLVFAPARAAVEWWIVLLKPVLKMGCGECG